jgi:hypothetical protein
MKYDEITPATGWLYHGKMGLLNHFKIVKGDQL